MKMEMIERGRRPPLLSEEMLPGGLLRAGLGRRRPGRVWLPICLDTAVVETAATGTMAGMVRMGRARCRRHPARGTRPWWRRPVALFVGGAKTGSRAGVLVVHMRWGKRAVVMILEKMLAGKGCPGVSASMRRGQVGSAVGAGR